MAIFRVEAEGDVMFIEAITQEAAYETLTCTVGDIPRSLLIWNKVDELPIGEELFRPYGQCE